MRRRRMIWGDFHVIPGGAILCALALAAVTTGGLAVANGCCDQSKFSVLSNVEDASSAGAMSIAYESTETLDDAVESKMSRLLTKLESKVRKWR